MIDHGKGFLTDLLVPSHKGGIDHHFSDKSGDKKNQETAERYPNHHIDHGVTREEFFSLPHRPPTPYKGRNTATPEKNFFRIGDHL
ncbi:MAG: hypothetical protein AB7J40_03870 [Candidatus Altimarinota bacterium]